MEYNQQCNDINIPSLNKPDSNVQTGLWATAEYRTAIGVSHSYRVTTGASNLSTRMSP